MDDIDLVFLKKDTIEDRASRIYRSIFEAETSKEGRQMLIDICNRIADSTTTEEYNYWVARRTQFFEEGEEAVRATIQDDIAEGFYPEESGEWEE